MDLPRDAWFAIMTYTKPSDLVRLGQTCRLMRTYCIQMPVWSTIREIMKHKPPSMRARKWHTSYQIVVAKACAVCRAKNKRRGSPLCKDCIEAHPSILQSYMVVANLESIIRCRSNNIRDTMHHVGHSVRHVQITTSHLCSALHQLHDTITGIKNDIVHLSIMREHNRNMELKLTVKREALHGQLRVLLG